MKSLKVRFTLIVSLALLCLYALVPTFQRYSMSREEFESLRNTDPSRYQYLSEHALHLGLDLQGGTHLLLRVRTEEVLDRELEALVNDVRDWLRQDSIPFLAARKTGTALEIAFQQPSDLERAREKLS